MVRVGFCHSQPLSRHSRHAREGKPCFCSTADGRRRAAYLLRLQSSIPLSHRLLEGRLGQITRLYLHMSPFVVRNTANLAGVETSDRRGSFASMYITSSMSLVLCVQQTHKPDGDIVEKNSTAALAEFQFFNTFSLRPRWPRLPFVSHRLTPWRLFSAQAQHHLPPMPRVQYIPSRNHVLLHTICKGSPHCLTGGRPWLWQRGG